jgi:hypothetical protein
MNKHSPGAAQMKPSHPLFVARFDDGYETCTAVFCSPDNLDWHRGVELAHGSRCSLLRWALGSIADKRLRGEPFDKNAERCMQETLRRPSQIIAARFELDGAVLESRAATNFANEK